MTWRTNWLSWKNRACYDLVKGHTDCASLEVGYYIYLTIDNRTP